jgi:hypothetical protein
LIVRLVSSGGDRRSASPGRVDGGDDRRCDVVRERLELGAPWIPGPEHERVMPASSTRAVSSSTQRSAGPCRNPRFSPSVISPLML